MNLPNPDNPNPAKEIRHYDYIDSLRGIAILGVIVVHLLDSLIYSRNLCAYFPHTLDVLLQSGRMGVQLFFVISALTLAMSMSSRRRVEKHPTKNYFIRRLFRIAPMFWLAEIVYMQLDQVHYFHQDRTAPGGIHFWHLLFATTFTNGWYPTAFNSVVPGGWSVAVEMGFYVLVPLLVLWVTTQRRAALAIVLSVAVSWILTRTAIALLASHWTGAFAGPFDIWVGYWLPVQMPIFLMGFLLFFLIRGDAQKTVAVEAARQQSARRIAAAVVLYLAAAYGEDRLPAHADLFNYLFGFAFLLAAWGLSLHAWPLIVNPVIKRIGTISYSCYLCHFFVVYVLMPPLARFLLARAGHPLSPFVLYPPCYLIALGLTVAISSLTYRFIEQPGIALGKRLIALGEARP